MEKTDIMKSSLITLQRRKYKIPKLYLLPLVDCLLLLPFFIIIASKCFVPIRAIPVYYETHGSPTHDYTEGKIFIQIDNPTDGNNMGTMRLFVSSTSARKADVQYDEMLSILRDLPAEHKVKMLIHSGREVLHEQFVKVLDIGRAAGIGKVGYGTIWVFGNSQAVNVQPRNHIPFREIKLFREAAERELIIVVPKIVPVQDRGGPIRFKEDE